MEDKTPDDVAFEKMLKRSGKAYDKAMPEADTTFGNMEVKPIGRSRPGGMKDMPEKTMPFKPSGAKDIKEKPYKKGGSVSSASKRADGIAQRGKTKGTMIMCGGGYTKGK
jgi:hypothetical protein